MNTEYEIAFNAQKELCEKLQNYHKKYDLEQEKLKKEFDYNKLDRIHINICDDFADDGFVPEGNIQQTEAIVYTDPIPDLEEQKILISFMEYIKENSLLPDSVEMDLYFYDATNRFPILVLEHEYNLNKRWKLRFFNITHKMLDKLMEKLEELTELNGISLTVSSES